MKKKMSKWTVIIQKVGQKLINDNQELHDLFLLQPYTISNHTIFKTHLNI